MKIYPVLHARFLRKDPDNPLERQVNDPPDPIVIEGADV